MESLHLPWVQEYEGSAPLPQVGTTLRCNLPSRAPLQDQKEATLQGTSLKWHPSLASSPTSLSCFPHSHTGAPWEYFLNQLLACKSLSWGLLLGNPTKDTIKKKGERENRLNGHLWEESAIIISWDSKMIGKWRPLNPNDHAKATHDNIQTQVSAWWALI